MVLFAITLIMSSSIGPEFEKDCCVVLFDPLIFRPHHFLVRDAPLEMLCTYQQELTHLNLLANQFLTNKVKGVHLLFKNGQYLRVLTTFGWGLLLHDELLEVHCYVRGELPYLVWCFVY
ncbi:LOW QUALITY PROTEIN: hypothetical protein PanWU01x14_037990 [Parasponia andersonii]|uniref:Uncharacterized protein n=1 Tax=Parasponia andersonii TaxID=3476 RepID=A0A2P5DS09_PARAD|nr:LOW QUALITY PROTEIN: hypothetical protein PanWU01x14_037990 [Parasponia andersonii]